MDTLANNSDFPDYDLTDYCKDNSSWKLAALNMSLSLLGLISGLFLIFLILKNQALRGHKFLLLNNYLSSVIFLLVLTGFVYTEEAINPCWHVKHFLCNIFQFMKAVLTTSSSFFLVALAFQQMKWHRQKFVTVNLCTICVIWVFAFIVSIPELVLGEVVSYDPDGVWSICGVYQGSVFAYLYIFLKTIFIEPLIHIFLLYYVIETGVYLVKSRHTTRGVTTGAILDARDIEFPKHFGLLVALTIDFFFGYLPLYSLKLANTIEDLTQRGRFGLFWLHIDAISTFFVILPPALTPLLIMLFSLAHRHVVLQSITNLMGHS